MHKFLFLWVQMILNIFLCKLARLTLLIFSINPQLLYIFQNTFYIPICSFPFVMNFQQSLHSNYFYKVAFRIKNVFPCSTCWKNNKNAWYNKNNSMFLHNYSASSMKRYLDYFLFIFMLLQNIDKFKKSEFLLWLRLAGTLQKIATYCHKLTKAITSLLWKLVKGIQMEKY